MWEGEVEAVRQAEGHGKIMASENIHFNIVC